MQIHQDLICQVYAGQKSKQTIDLVLQAFIPEYEKLNCDYACRPDDKDYVFESEEEMLNYFIENKGLNQVFYWNKYLNNPDKIIVGALITDDDKLIMSLTIEGALEIANTYFEKLKKVLNSDIGVISDSSPAEYDNGKEFEAMYGNKTH